MREEHLERALAGEPDIVPTSGFVQAVMEVVRQEAAAPAPIPFPWGRALTGAFLVVVTAFVMPGAFYLQHRPGPSAGSSEIRAVLDLLVRVGQDRDAWTIAAALALTCLLRQCPAASSLVRESAVTRSRVRARQGCVWQWPHSPS